MMKLLRIALALSLFITQSYAQTIKPGVGTSGTDLRPGVGASGFVTTCSQASDFIARTTGFSNTDKTNYDNLICGMVTDGDWANLDALYVGAAPNQTASLLNLVSTSFALSLTGSPTFTANQGWTGGATGNYVSGVALTTLSKYIRNDASLSGWEYTDRASTNAGLMNASGIQQISPLFTATASVRVNGGGVTFVNTSSRGHFCGRRTTSTLQEAYFNGVSQGTDATASSAVVSGVPQLPQTNNTFKWSFFHFGNSTVDCTRVYNRLRTFATAVGIP